MNFQLYIGIDYSGAKTPESRLKGLQVFSCDASSEPVKVVSPSQHFSNWNRNEVADYCQSIIDSGNKALIGIDHGFSFPLSYMKRYNIGHWDDFLQDFATHWPTSDPGSSVELFRDDNPRQGETSEFRLCERWTATAKSVFQFDVQGSVAKSTFTGLPWLNWLRQNPDNRGKVHFWPFDGFMIPENKCVLVEAYPALYKRRYDKGDRTADEHDAWSTAAWMRDCDRRGTLEQYFKPPLTPDEILLASLEGWILGVY